MKYKTLIFVFILLFPLLILAQEKSIDVVRLKDGRVLKGTITRQVEGEFIRLKVETHTMTIYFEDIESVNTEEKDADEPVRKYFNPARDDDYFKKNKNKYWSLATGIGQSYGGLFGIRFQQRFGEKMGMGYHAGIGYTPRDSMVQRGFMGFAIGVKFFFFKSYYINLQYGTAGLIVYQDVWGNFLNQEILYGPAAMAGADWFFSQYFGMNAAAGVAFNVSHPDAQSAIFKIDFGLVVKFQ